MFPQRVEGVVQFESGMTGGEAGDKDVHLHLDRITGGLNGMKGFNQLLIADFYAVNQLPVVLNDLKEVFWCVAGCDVSLIRSLSEFLPERVEHQFGQGTKPLVGFRVIPQYSAYHGGDSLEEKIRDFSQLNTVQLTLDS